MSSESIANFELSNEEPAASFESAWESHKKSLEGFLLTCARNQHWTEDLLQDCSVKIMQAWPALPPERRRSPLPWMLTIARRVFIDSTRYNGHRLYAPYEAAKNVASTTQTPVEAAASKDLFKAIYIFIKELPYLERTVARLYLDDLIAGNDKDSASHVAELLGKTSGHVDFLRHCVKVKLREFLRELKSGWID
jgi:DNA-directed RNA polymerase specialized sigma24 family protein